MVKYMKRKKHAYLYRLIVIIMLVLFVPTVLFFNFFWNRSYKEIENSNQIYSENLISSFADSFMVKLSELKQYALEISVSSKDSRSVFWKGSEYFDANEYWYYEAVREIEDFRIPYVEYYGVYYYEMDCVITRGGTQTAKQYIETRLLVDDPNAETWSFFELQKYKSGDVIFSTTNTGSRNDGAMLVGYCTTMGKNQDPVLIFFVINSNDYKDVLSVVYSNSGTHFYVSDAEAKKIYLALGEAAYDTLDLTKTEEELTINEERQKIFYLRGAENLPLSFIMHITEDSYQNNMVSFSHNMRNILWVTAVILLTICGVILYIVYAPIYKLVAELDYQEGDEFETIRSMLDDRNTKILEQEMLIIDLLLKHLIYGTPISEKKLTQLGVTAEYKHYCVFILEGHTLLSGEIRQITEGMERQFAIRLFVTDWQEEDKNILIMFMKHSQIDEMETWLRGWLEEHYVEAGKLYTGKVVDKLNDVRVSMLSCLEKELRLQRTDETVLTEKTDNHDGKDFGSTESRRKKSKEDILKYLEVHYRDENLSLTQMADALQISHYTLSRMFRNQIGVGFTEYVNSKRIEYAKELLLTTSYSVREIGVMVGITNDNYFSRIFKTMVGVSPLAFREDN